MSVEEVEDVDPLVLLVEAIERARTASDAAAEAASEAVGKAREGAGRITALETATTALKGEVRDWRQNSLQAAEARRKGRLWAIPGLILGLVLYPLLASTMPYGGYLASLAVNRTVNRNRWNAGTALMEAANTSAWNRLVADWNLVGGTPANARSVAACRKLAVQIRTAQPCVITVPAP